MGEESVILDRINRLSKGVGAVREEGGDKSCRCVGKRGEIQTGTKVGW